MQNKYDVIVLGSGPGGEGAAMRCVKAGKSVAVCDYLTHVGGSCTHNGTIPSKALRHATHVLNEQNSLDRYDYQQLLKSADLVINQQMNLRRSFYDRNWVDIIDGHASFIDANKIKVKLSNGMSKEFSADHFIIAVGSKPYHPKNIDFTHPRVIDSDSVLDIATNPRTLTIYGAGVIGCEYASIFRGLKTKVNLINNRAQLLTFLDDEIIDALSYHLRETGVLIRHNEEYEKVVADDNGVTVFLKSNKQIRSDYLLWAQGRTGNTSNMNLDKIGIETDSRANIVINEDHQTALPHIYAVGDVIGYPSLASAAYDQGRYVARHIVGGESEKQLLSFIPTGIYTLPEISSVGLNERELTEQKVPYEVGRSFFKHLARAQITGQTTGMLKILFHRETFEVLGIHCFGQGAAEIIHIGQMVMAQKGEANTLKQFINTTFNYPTMAEAYRVAALNGLNRVEHF